MIIQIIKFESALSEEEVMNVADTRKPDFQALEGLVQKYYVKPMGNNRYGGIYVWDSKESMEAYRNSDLAKSIPQAYGIVGSPEIEIMELIYPLRD